MAASIDPEKLSNLLDRAGIGKITKQKLLKANANPEDGRKSSHGAPAAPKAVIKKL